MSIRILNTLSSNAYQSVSFTTNEGEDVKLILRFIPSQETWFLDVESESLTVRGLALMSFANILDPYHNNMTWGLYVWSEDGFDPWRVDDFVTGRIKLGIFEDLERAIVQEYLNVPSAD